MGVELGGMIVKRETKEAVERPVPLALCPQYI
jgi:hypothetical protein